MGWPGETVEQLIVNYPQRRVRAGDWSPAVAEFVTAVIAGTPRYSKPHTNTRLRLAGQLATWWAGKGRPLDVEQVFDPYTVDQYVKAGMPGGRGGRVTYASVLRVLGQQATVRAPWPRRDRMPKKPPALPPYSATELALLECDARAQSTPLGRRRFRAFLDLGLGAGLDSNWVNRVLPDDVFVEHGFVLVRVGDPAPRVVPVREQNAQSLLDVAADTPPGEFLVGGTSTRNAADQYRTLSLSDDRLKFSPTRLRHTWFVAHLAAGTPLRDLLVVAGLAESGLNTLRSLLSHVPPTPDHEAYERLTRV